MIIIELIGKQVSFKRLDNGCLYRTNSDGVKRPQLQLEDDTWATITHLVWEKFRGPITEDKQVLHNCDNKPCCEVTHLYLGTSSENAKDTRDRGHFGRQKLTWADVEDIKRRYDPVKRNGVELAREYGVVHRTIYRILSGEGWEHHPQRVKS
jgi:hypothetical protein